LVASESIAHPAVSAICSYEAGSAGILPASVGADWRERKAVSPERCLSDACRLEGGAPGLGLLRL